MRTKQKEKDDSWLYAVGFFVVLFILGQCISVMEGSPSPTPTTRPIPTSSIRYMTEAETKSTLEAARLLSSEYPDVDSNTLEMSCPTGCDNHVDCCDIKGNIGFDTGAKIYHLPGQDYYDATSIDSTYGERWFCTEAEAISNGWRKSYQ